MRSSVRLVLFAALALNACRALDLPEPPGPGSIQGTVVFTRPGSTSRQIAGGATVELLGSSLKTTAESSTGHFTLEPIPVVRGALLIRYDQDGDGTDDFLKVVRLEEVKAGPGKTVALGEVVLAGNAALRGTVLRSDALASPSGHGGTSAFMPEGPFLTYTGDNGAFLMESLPEGEVSLAFFRDGYRTQQMTVTLRAGETFSLPTVILAQESGTPTPVEVHGSVTMFDGASPAGVTVSTNTGETTATAADGTYTFPALPPGVYTFGFVKTGYQTAVLPNIPVSGPSFQVPAVVLVPGTSTNPTLDAGPGYDAGTVVDAGADAGTDKDAGTDAGTDAGVDAGTDAGADAGTDAGTDAGADAGTDAGMDAGMDAGIDAGIDAGFDAGLPLPVAIIGAPPAFVGVFQSFQLSGVGSQGVGPFIYKWSQTRGPTVVIPNNNTTQAATPSMSAPSMPTTLGFTLEVTDIYNQTSPPSAEVLVLVGSRPTASIASGYPATVYASQTVTLDGSQSMDSSGTGITTYLWTVSPAGYLQTTLNGGKQLQVTFPSTVTTPVVVNVSLTVVNGIGIASNPASVNLTLTNLAAPPWTVDAGPPQTVNNGAIVTLTGRATAPGDPGATFTYLWSPAADDAGTPDWQLTDATNNVTTFVAPPVVGPSRLINFSLTATSTSGLTPPTAVGSTWVNVRDATPPSIVGTSVDGLGQNGTLGVTVDFSEPLDPAYLNSTSVSGLTVRDRILATPSRLVFTFGPLAVPSSSYTVYVTGVRDLSPQGNTMSSQQFSFVAASKVTPAFESTQSFTANPVPGHVVLQPSPTDPALRVLLFGRNGTAPVVLQAFDPYGCASAPCTVATDGSAPSATLGATLPRGKRSLQLGGDAFSTFDSRNYAAMTSPVVLQRQGTTWSLLPTPPGWLFTDTFKLWAGWVENGLKVADYDTTMGAWNTGAAETVSTDGVLFSSDTLSDPIVQGTGSPGASTFIVARTSKTGELRAFRKAWLGTTWTYVTDLATTGIADKIVDVRVVPSDGYVNSVWAAYQHQSGALSVRVFGDINDYNQPYATGVTGFDLALRKGGLVLAATVNGQLHLRYVAFGAGSSSTLIPGPHPGNVFNNDPMCTADSPELSLVHEKVAVSWAEHCGAGPWKIYFRLLN